MLKKTQPTICESDLKLDDNQIEASEDIEDEDLRVIADMSGLAPRGHPFGRIGLSEAKPNVDKCDMKDKPDLSRESVYAAVKGALAATFAIYFVYAITFGVFIFLLTRIL